MNYIAGILSLLFLVLSILVIRRSVALAKSLSSEKSSDEFSAVTGENKWNAIGFVIFFVLGCVGGVVSFIDSMVASKQRQDPIQPHVIERYRRLRLYHRFGAIRDRQTGFSHHLQVVRTIADGDASLAR